MDVVSAVRGSRTYRVARTLRRWAAASAAAGLLRRAGGERVVKALVGLFVAASVGAVFGSSLGAAVKFLSFLALFAVVAAVVVSIADPPA